MSTKRGKERTVVSVYLDAVELEKLNKLQEKWGLPQSTCFRRMLREFKIEEE